MNNEIMQILASQAFQKIFCLDFLTIAQFNALCTLLIKNNIDFDTTYNAGTRRDEPSLQVTIYINPNTSINYTFDGGVQSTQSNTNLSNI